MITYTPQLVERLLRNYLDIRVALDLRGVDYRANTPFLYTASLGRETPLGRTSANPSWPFMEKQAAAPVQDGKRTARQREDLHCSAIDLELGLARVSDEDRWILIHHVILGEFSLQDLTTKFHLKGINGARMRVQRAIARLARQMEYSV